ncbi:MAG: metallophosphoesterase [Thiotrichales bacterium]
MTKLPANNPLIKVLEGRVSPTHLRQRLGIEHDREARVFGQGFNFFHIENWYSIHGVMRGLLRLAFLHERGRRNALNVQVTSNDLWINNLPSAFEGFTLLHVSDLHLDINEYMADVLAARIAELEYNLCVITGDFRAKTFGPFDQALDGMSRVRGSIRQPTYAVLGNHDSIQMVPGLEGMNVQVLLNESVTIERGGERLYIAGIDDPHYYKSDNIEKAAHGIPEHAASILLSHTPEPYRAAAFSGFDVMLAGHTHGGQICLPGGVPVMSNARCPRAMVNGPWRYRGMRGYTSRGSGVSVVDVRFNCPPEITLHRLRRVEPYPA